MACHCFAIQILTWSIIATILPLPLTEQCSRRHAQVGRRWVSLTTATRIVSTSLLPISPVGQTCLLLASSVLCRDQKRSVASGSGAFVLDPGDLEIIAGMGCPLSATVGLEQNRAEIWDVVICANCTVLCSKHLPGALDIDSHSDRPSCTAITAVHPHASHVWCVL